LLLSEQANGLLLQLMLGVLVATQQLELQLWDDVKVDMKRFGLVIEVRINKGKRKPWVQLANEGLPGKLLVKWCFRDADYLVWF